ncbi:MAG: hypothetical protein O3B13_01250 [Planctomycetota bacterium]|nr:hypothetical protein [Planctomycetota bacterium]
MLKSSIIFLAAFFALVSAFVMLCMVDFFFGLNIVPKEIGRWPGRLVQWLFPME